MEKVDLSALRCYKSVDPLRAEKSLGTLGGGNHFIEVDRDEDGDLYLVIHSGSRHLGLEIANYYQEAAYNALTSYSKEEIDSVIETLKASGRANEIQGALKRLKSKRSPVPKHLAYVEGALF